MFVLKGHNDYYSTILWLTAKVLGKFHCLAMKAVE